MTDTLRTDNNGSIEARNELEHLLLEFDRSWTPQRLESVVASLPFAGTPFHQTALRELIAIDMERHWQQGQRPSVEDYLSRFPACDSTTAAKLVAVEDEIRQQFGDAVSPRAQAVSGHSRTAETQLMAPLSTPRPPFTAGRPASEGESSTAARSGGPPRPAEATLSGTFGRYQIEKLLGKGGMGAVYLAEDTAMGRKVALKIPRVEEAGDDELIRRLYGEARAAAILHHPGICPVYDAGQIDGQHYLSMARIEGQSLKKLISRENPPPLQSAVTIIEAMARALSHAHAHDVIHRDLKPENVMLNREQQPVIMDFGLARRINQPASTRLTQTGVTPGTPAYMSPEQTRIGQDQIGPQTDIFSLGIIFYELLTGAHPFPGSTKDEVFAQIRTQEPRPLDQLRPGIDPQLQAICGQMLSRQLDQRYRSMDEVAADLSAWLQKADVAKQGRIPPRIRLLVAGLLAAVILPATAFLYSRTFDNEPAGLTEQRTALTPLPAAAGLDDPPPLSANLSASDVPAVSRDSLFLNGGHWIVEGEELVQSKPGRGTLLFGDLDWTDYDVSVETMTRSTEKESQGGNLFFRTLSLEDNYVFSLGAYGGDWNELIYNVDSRWHRDGTLLPTQHKPGHWYRMRVRVRGPQITCWLDDELLFEFRNSTFASGCIGLGTWNSVVAWRNLRVTAPDGRVLWEGWPALPGADGE